MNDRKLQILLIIHVFYAYTLIFDILCITQCLFFSYFPSFNMNPIEIVLYTISNISKFSNS